MKGKKVAVQNAKKGFNPFSKMLGNIRADKKDKTEGEENDQMMDKDFEKMVKRKNETN